MGFLSRRREAREQLDHIVDLAEALSMISREQAASREDFMTGSGDFDLRKMVVDVWDGSPTHAMQTVKSYWRPEGGDASGDRLYDDEFARHWDGLNREKRGREIEFLISYSNRMVDQGVEDRGPELQAMYALVIEKVRLRSPPAQLGL